MIMAGRKWKQKRHHHIFYENFVPPGLKQIKKKEQSMNAIFGGAMCTQQFQYPFENPHGWFPIFHSYFSGILGKRMVNLMIGKFMMIESCNSLEEVHWSLPLHVMKILVSPNKSSKSWFLPKMKWSDLSWSKKRILLVKFWK